MIRKLMAWRRYRRFFRLDNRPAWRSDNSPEARPSAQRLHARVYRERGYVSDEDLTVQGLIGEAADPYQRRARYVVIWPVEAADSTEPVAAARWIEAASDGGHASFQSVSDLPISPAGRRLIESYRPSECVEISALVKRPGVSTEAVLWLYRALWQASLASGHQLWLMACDEGLLRRLHWLFGQAIVPVGPAVYYKGHTVVPSVLELAPALEQLRRPVRGWPPLRGLHRDINRFFLDALGERVRTRSLSDRLVGGLWWLYGYTYDGLRHFWPYCNLLDQVVAYLAPQSGEQLLELGCGTGNVLERLIGVPGVTVTGIDRSATMLGRAQRKLAGSIRAGQLRLEQADLIEWLSRQPDDAFDAAVSVNVLYAIADQSALWQELTRVVRPGGRIVVTTSVRPGSWPIIAEHLRHAPWRQLLHPRLSGVFVVDALINGLGRSGTFAFANEATLRRAVERAGGLWEDRGHCYGGTEQGVNLLFRVTIPS